MPTTLPVRRLLSCEHQAIADRLAAIDRLARTARLDPQVRLRTLLCARVGLWLIRRQARRLAQRSADPRSTPTPRSTEG